MSSEKRKRLERLQAFLRENGSSLPAINQAAQILYREAFPLDSALEAYETYLRQQPRAASAAFNFAWYLSRDGQFQAAVEQYRRAIALGVAQPEEAHLNIANLYMDHLEDNDRALEEFDRARAINPRYRGAWYNRGNLAEQLGDRAGAAECFEKCLEIDPGDDSALARLSDTHHYTDPDDHLLARLRRRAESSPNSDLHYALGSAFNQLADYDAAWTHFTRANELDRATLPPYRRERTEAWFGRIRERCGTDWLSRFSGPSGDPVFICGMFRTGSTLLEQVLAAHTRFTAGGESEFFPRLVLSEFHEYPDGLDEATDEELLQWRSQHDEYEKRRTGGETRLTDKRPDNFLFIGLIKAVLPSARIVVTERDWRDSALSIFSTRLGAGQAYATHLADIRHYMKLQGQLIDHWSTLLGDGLIRVNYEDLVTAPRETVGKLLRSLGEEWEDGCLSFDQLTNPVKTASVWQVREPLHTKSIGRWKNYRKYFEETFGPED